MNSLNSLAALLVGRERNAEAESLYRIAITVLDKKGFVTARKPVLTQRSAAAAAGRDAGSICGVAQEDAQEIGRRQDRGSRPHPPRRSGAV